MNLPQPIDVPDYPWLDRLRKGHIIWLVKEQCHARVVFALEPPDPGCIAGRIGIQRYDHTYTEAWWSDTYGHGMDGSQVIAPTEGNLPDEPAPISDVWQRHVERTLAGLIHRLEQLETDVTKLSEILMSRFGG